MTQEGKLPGFEVGNSWRFRLRDIDASLPSHTGGVYSVLALAALAFGPLSAEAHGEKSQQAFLRMRTIHWYDLRWLTDRLRVNDKMTIAGKFHVFKGWPETANNPESSPAFLNIGIPGPVFTRQESYIGGQFVPRSVNLTLGEDYSFKVVLQARRPGRWHVHTMMNVEGAGPIIGPGKWVQIEGTMADYKSEVQTLTGRTEDIERVGTAGIVGWSAFWFCSVALGSPIGRPGHCSFRAI